MAHMTKVNGTAYEIVGGSIKVNGTDYDIIKGKTKVGGADYDIEFDTGEWVWPGWDNATWYDVNKMCVEITNGNLPTWPDDVITGATKMISMYMDDGGTETNVSTYDNQYDYKAYVARKTILASGEAYLECLIVFPNKSLRWANNSGYNTTFASSNIQTFAGTITGSHFHWGTKADGFSLDFLHSKRASITWYIKNSSDSTGTYLGVSAGGKKVFTVLNKKQLIPTPTLTSFDGYIEASYDVSQITEPFWTVSQDKINPSQVGAIYITNPSNGSAEPRNLTSYGKIALLFAIGNPNGV